MKKREFMTACLSLLLFGCGKGSALNEKVKIGLSIPTQREERWVRDLAQLREEASKFGVELLVEIADNDSGRQLIQCESLLAQKINVLIVAPHDSNAAAPIAEKAARQGVKIIAYDRLIRNAPVDLYISFDSVKIGEMQGRYLAKLAPKGRYILLSGAPIDHNSALLRQGAMNILKPLADRGDIRIVADQPIADWRPEVAKGLMQRALAANPGEIRAVLAPNDGTAGGVIQALTLYGLAGKVLVTGQDADAAAVRRIMAGTQAMTVFKDTRQLASAAFGAAMNFAAGGNAPVNALVPNGKTDVPSLLLEPVTVDRSNMGRILIDGGYLSRQAVYGRPGE